MILHYERNSQQIRSRRYMVCEMCVVFGLLIILFGTVRLTTAETAPTEKLVEIVFTALDSDGKPVPGATVALRYDWFYPHEKIWTTDADGCVKAKIPSLIAETNQSWFEVYHRERGLLARMGFSPEIAEQITIKCTLDKGRRITGKVIDSEGKPVENAIVAGSNSAVLRIAAAQTDKDGQFELDIIHPSIMLHEIFAFKPKIGFASVSSTGRPILQSDIITSGRNRLEEKLDEGPLTFQLEKREEPVTVKVVEKGSGRPLEGIMVSPGQSGLEALLSLKTDAQGTAVFDWFSPALDHVLFYASGSNPRFEKTGEARRYGIGYQNWFQEMSHPVVMIELPRRVEVRGSVRREDGSPVPWCRLRYQTGHIQVEGISTDHAGNFSFDVNEESDLTILPSQSPDSSLVAPMQWTNRVRNTWEIEKEGKEPTRFDFVLKEGTKVYGKVVSSKDQTPISNQIFNIKELKGPGEVPGSDFSGRFFHTDTNGNYTVYLPPGVYQICDTNDSLAKSLAIRDEKEIPLDLKAVPRQVR